MPRAASVRPSWKQASANWAWLGRSGMSGPGTVWDPAESVRNSSGGAMLIVGFLSRSGVAGSLPKAVVGVADRRSLIGPEAAHGSAAG